MSKAKLRAATSAHGALLTSLTPALNGQGGAPQSAAAPFPAVGELAGRATSDTRLQAIRKASQSLRLQAVRPLIVRALNAVENRDFTLGAELSLKILQREPELGIGWHLMAICREEAGDWAWAVQCYQSAFELMPEHYGIAHDLGRMAQSMGDRALAEKCYKVRIATDPGAPDLMESVANLAILQKEGFRYDEAIETLRFHLSKQPDCALLWNTLGGVTYDQGDMANSETFFNEALRCDPDFSPSLYNRANVRAAVGRKEAALRDAEEALATCTAALHKAQFGLGVAFRRLEIGDLPGGWDAYEARLDTAHRDHHVYHIPVQAWTPDTPLAGKRLVAVAEQGLGDEVLFANLIDDLLAEIGPRGALTLAVEPRLVALFQRSWPAARVVSHKTVSARGRSVRLVPALETDGGSPDDYDCWAPLGSFLRRYRASLDAFPSDRRGYLVPDAARAARWRTELDALPGLKVGIVWKSIKIASDRARLYSPFEAWAPILRTPGVTFVDLQYGEHGDDLAYARDKLGVDIWTPPGLDLKDDLDGLTALASQLDIALGPANASTNLAAAAGAEHWLITLPNGWTHLGTEGYPWYPGTRMFKAPGYNDWAPVMRDVAAALAVAAKAHAPRAWG